MKLKNIRNNSGLIIIMALWSLGLLSVFAVAMGIQTRQKLMLSSRLEKRNELPGIAESGLRKAIASLNREIKDKGLEFNFEFKMFLQDNEVIFGPFEVGNGIAEISYERRLDKAVRYGVVDEESKININKADKVVLERLVQSVLRLEDESSRELAEAIFDWRRPGKSQITGFSSDGYYKNLRDPYPPKDAEYELLEELLLVKGMNNEYYEKILPFITVYGGGQVNINTAPREVLFAVGFDYGLADKILAARWGEDATEATEDDIIFKTPFALGGILKSLFELKPEEAAIINGLLAQNKLTTLSFFYKIRSTGRLSSSPAETNSVVCVYNAAERTIEYWREYT